MRAFSFALALVVVVAAAVPAAADPLDDAAAALAAAPIWVHPGAQRVLDVDAVTAAVGDAPIKIAVLPAGPSVSEVRGMPRDLAERLPGNTVAVIAGRYFYAGSDVLCADEAGLAASRSIEVNEQQLDADGNSDLTKALTDFVAAVKAAPTCRAADAARTGADASTVGVLPWVLAVLGVALAGITAWVFTARTRTRSRASARRAGAEAAVRDLAALLGALPAERAAEARDRLAEAEALLAGATTDDQFHAAAQTAARGHAAARAAQEER